jgi:hypothetical protein
MEQTYREEHDVSAARMLGWASLGIAALELFAPRAVERLIGVDNKATLIRSMGARELLSGVAILGDDRPSQRLVGGVWSRVIGDAVDLALLAAAARQTRNPGGLAVAVGMVLGIAALDVLYAARLKEDVQHHGGNDTSGHYRERQHEPSYGMNPT